MNQQRASVYIYRSLVVFGALLFSSIAQGASFQLSLQPIQVCDDSGMICSNLPYSETAQNDIWAQADLTINFLPTVRLLSSQFINVDNTDETFELFGINPVTRVPVDPLANEALPSPVINFWFVSNGGTFPKAQPLQDENKSWVDGDNVSEADLLFAHALGHNLGLRHTDPPDRSNLMNAAPLDTLLTAEQISVIQNSEFLTVVPVPAAVWLFGTALIGVAGFGKRKKMT